MSESREANFFPNNYGIVFAGIVSDQGYELELRSVDKLPNQEARSNGYYRVCRRMRESCRDDAPDVRNHYQYRVFRLSSSEECFLALPIIFGRA